MAENYINIDRETPMLLPPDLREWVPPDHIAHFILEALAEVRLSGAIVNVRGSGSAQYPPRLLLGLLIYGYATGRFSSREIERATHDDVAMRYLAADTHPDHDTICTFRRRNAVFIQAAFVRVLELAKELGVLKVGTVSVDGTKVLANASKHKAVSHARAGEQIAMLETEVAALLERAAQADSAPLADGLTLEGELALRQKRLAKLRAARAVIEDRVKAHAALAQQAHADKIAERAARQARGDRVGRPPVPPPDTPTGKEQFNFTDPQSRIMKAGNGEHFEQCYNAQAAVDATPGGSRLIVGAQVCAAPNDKQQLVPTVQVVTATVGAPSIVLADSGYYSEKAVAQVEQNSPTLVYAAVKRQRHHRTLADLAPPREPVPLPSTATASDRMHQRVTSPAGRALYRLRMQTIEPVFGIIKAAMGFRRFSLRGLTKVALEWNLVCLTYNLRRLFILKTA